MLANFWRSRLFRNTVDMSLLRNFCGSRKCACVLTAGELFRAAVVLMRWRSRIGVKFRQLFLLSLWYSVYGLFESRLELFWSWFSWILWLCGPDIWLTCSSDKHSKWFRIANVIWNVMRILWTISEYKLVLQPGYLAAFNCLDNIYL